LSSLIEFSFSKIEKVEESSGSKLGELQELQEGEAMAERETEVSKMNLVC